MYMNLRWMLAIAVIATGFLIQMPAQASTGPESDANNVYWDDVFSSPGVSGSLKAIAKDSAGNLYIGGWFTTVGDIAANNIAQWDGAAWTPLGSGTDNSVTALAADSAGNVYAAGFFGTAGGVAASRIAKWDAARLGRR